MNAHENQDQDQSTQRERDYLSEEVGGETELLVRLEKTEIIFERNLPIFPAHFSSFFAAATLHSLLYL